MENKGSHECVLCACDDHWNLWYWVPVTPTPRNSRHQHMNSFSPTQCVIIIPTHTVCENGEERYYCFRSPCEGAVCPGQPEATCNDDYCGGCNTRWVLDEEDVTDSCCESLLISGQCALHLDG